MTKEKNSMLMYVHNNLVVTIRNIRGRDKQRQENVCRKHKDTIIIGGK